MKKRVLSLFLALTLCLTLLPTAALATENETSAQSAEEALLSTEGAEGTAENPILIGSLDELNKFVYRVNEDGLRELCAQLTADITLGDSWTSIGNNLAYIGTFDGNGHTIYAENGVANLFGRIGKAGRVQGLTVEIGTMTALSGSGVIARENSGTIERCSVRIYDTLTISSYFGLIAYDNAGTIEHCRSSVSKFSASGSAKAAGIAYTNYKYGTIKSCYFNGKFRYDETTGAQDYAITSSLRGGTVENCYCLNGQLYYDKHNYLDESLPGLHGAAQRQHHNKTYDYTLENGQVTWLLNNGEGASTNNTDPWRLDKNTFGGTPTLDPADGRVTKSGDTYTWESLHTHIAGGKLHEFEALDSTPSGSGYYYLDANTTLSDAQKQLDDLKAEDTSSYDETTKADYDEQVAALEETVATAQATLDESSAKLETVTAEAYDEILPTAQDVLARAQSGEDFDSLIETYGQDTGMNNEPNKSRGYLVCDGLSVYEQSFQDAAMALEKVGDVSAELVKTSYGYHILQYATDIAAGEVEYTDEIKSNIYDTMLSDAKDAAYEAAVTQWVSEAKVTTYPKVMK